MTCVADRHPRPPRVLVIADPRDTGALRVARALAAREDVTCLPVSVDQLLLARRWAHDPLGDTEIVLGNGTRLCNETIAAVLCRVGEVSPPQFARARAADRGYAQEEFYSLLLSWLAQLGARVHNRPHPGSLSGIQYSPLEDHLLLARSGVPAAPVAAASHSRYLPAGGGVAVLFEADQGAQALAGVPFESRAGTLLAGFPALRVLDALRHAPRTVTVVGDAVIGPAGEWPSGGGIAQVARTIARSRGLSIAGVGFRVVDEARPVVCAVDPVPSLDEPGAADAVAQLLATTARRHAAACPERVL